MFVLRHCRDSHVFYDSSKFCNNITISEEKVIVNGLDVGHEIKKVRGGAFINELNARMLLKLDCIRNYNEAKCSWIKPLKYYAYSLVRILLLIFCLSCINVQTMVFVVHPLSNP